MIGSDAVNESPEVRRARALRANVPTNVMNVAMMIIDEDHDCDDLEPWMRMPSWLVDLFKQKPIGRVASHGAYCTCPHCADQSEFLQVTREGDP